MTTEKLIRDYFKSSIQHAKTSATLKTPMNSYDNMLTVAERQLRNGGYPKFPQARLSVQQCGGRAVSHHAQRGGTTAIAKIVGGTSAPYGAYPWQVSM